ncbi:MULTISPECIES: type IV secretion system protein TraC [Enterobacterales]|uniref:TraC n=8 Tax=Enterobacterales TaxID=91347 RepID=A0A2L1KUU7_PROMI|nr:MULTISPECIES: type IV secretion system protein TraC [Enterobacterales]ELB1544934.1 type IV secretion system protein TraC [Morganella morganii]MEB1123122.1 type IV secretion system protein TraC [Citrobacter freundii]HAZ8046738.1 type IV secretion system protein TraC [Escherichia coli]AGX85655.1 conjugal transfer ATP-binding protein TraC [Providencia rettgeri]ARD70794.1 conjugal transfer ATP-binding protein TraC [Providencia rettgeri]
MATASILKKMQTFKRFSSLCPVLAIHDDENIFICENNYIGFGFKCIPLSGTTGKELSQLKTLLSGYFPNSTVIQISLFASPNISHIANRSDFLRMNCQNQVMKTTSLKRSRFLLAHTSKAFNGTNTKARNCELYFTVKVPIKNDLSPSLNELNTVREMQGNFETTLRMTGFAPQQLTREIYLTAITSMINQGSNATWRDRMPIEVDEDKMISEQLLELDSLFFVRSNYVGFGNPEDESSKAETNTTFARTISAKKLPRRFQEGSAQYFLGDLMNGATGIKNPCIITMTLVYPDQQNAKSTFTSKRTVATRNADGPSSRWVPSMKTTSAGFDVLAQKIDDGQPIYKAAFTVSIFANSVQQLNQSVQEATSYLNNLSFKMIPDVNFVAPIFLGTLPLFYEANADKVLGRSKTLAVEEALVLSPLYSDWQGTGNPVLTLTSRNGQVQTMDFFQSDTNYNVCIAASSGSGKSFLTNYIISAYRSLGAKVWVIDAGDSYKKLCQMFDGSYVDFHPSTKPCLNFFEIIEDYFGEDEDAEEGTGEEDLVIGLLSVMAAPQDGLGDFETSRLKNHVAKLVRKHGKETTIDMVADSCKSDPDQRIKDIGEQLYPFTKEGQYGKYFTGKNNISFDNPFTVLELGRIEKSEHLKQIILMQLIYQIQQDMYLGDRDQMKIVIIDEAWALLTGNIGAFIEKGYRRFRKYYGSAITITQSINDMYKDRVGLAITDNSAFLAMLGQTESAVNKARREERLPLDEAGYEFLKTVKSQTGIYSEVYFMSAMGGGICRFLVDKFSYMLYTTRASEVQAIEDRLKQGQDVIDAIDQYLIEQGYGNDD